MSLYKKKLACGISGCMVAGFPFGKAAGGNCFIFLYIASGKFYLGFCLYM
jgi:hypothetical protein